MKTKKSASNDITKEIALRAYFIWENEGRPQGREHIHWHRAEAEIVGERPAKQAAEPAAAPKKVTAKKPAAKNPGEKKSVTNGIKAAKSSPGEPAKTAAKAVKPKLPKAKKSPDA